MSHNPYAAPEATLADATKGSVAMYSPTQAALGALLGGPVGLIYFLHRNFVALGNQPAAKKCLMYGALLIVVLLIALPLLPANFPNAPLNIVYILAGRSIAQKYQLTKQAIAESTEYTFKSNWNVFGMGLLCFLGSVIVVIGPLLGLEALGLIK
jgi:hypothetical protein